MVSISKSGKAIQSKQLFIWLIIQGRTLIAILTFILSVLVQFCYTPHQVSKIRVTAAISSPMSIVSIFMHLVDSVIKNGSDLVS